MEIPTHDKLQKKKIEQNVKNNYFQTLETRPDTEKREANEVSPSIAQTFCLEATSRVGLTGRKKEWIWGSAFIGTKGRVPRVHSLSVNLKHKNRN